jgi:hypothetical protein
VGKEQHALSALDGVEDQRAGDGRLPAAGRQNKHEATNAHGDRCFDAGYGAELIGPQTDRSRRVRRPGSIRHARRKARRERRGDDRSLRAPSRAS